MSAGRRKFLKTLSAIPPAVPGRRTETSLFRVKLVPTPEFTNWPLYYGSRVKVMEPASLRTQVAEEHLKAAMGEGGCDFADLEKSTGAGLFLFENKAGWVETHQLARWTNPRVMHEP